jgi:uncharacterized protein (TIGR02118 family)
MQKKIMLLLTQNADQRPGMLEPYLASEGQRIRGKLPKGSTHFRAFHIADDPIQQGVPTAQGNDATLVFDAIFEVSAPNTAWDKLLPVVQEIPIRLGNILDRSKSAVIVGSEHIIIPGEELLMIVYPLRRLPAMTSVAFHDYWLNNHAAIARTLPGLRGYRQFHADAEETSAAGKLIGVGISDFEGAAQGYFKNPEDFLSIMSQPEVQVALEDEKKFIDHSRSPIGLYYVAWRTSI